MRHLVVPRVTMLQDSFPRCECVFLTYILNFSIYDISLPPIFNAQKAIEDYHYALSREEELFHQADTCATDRRRRRMLDMDLRYDAAYDTDQGHELLRAYMPPPPPGNLAMLDDIQRAQVALDAACQSLGIDTTTDAPPTANKAASAKPSSNGPTATAALSSPTTPRPIKRPPTTPYIHTSPIPHTSPLPKVEGLAASSTSGSTISAQLLADESHSRGYLLRLQGQHTLR